jgi:thiamine-monophosphate kinase
VAISEDVALQILKGILPRAYGSASQSVVEVGIGDDAALLSLGPTQGSKNKLVWTIDACEEGTHFLWRWMNPEDVAHKAFHAALSDIPAMGGTPVAALCQLTLGPEVTPAWLRRFAEQQRQCALTTKTPLVGGNITSGESLRVVMTCLGAVEEGRALLRTGAQPGDEVWLVGQVGLARAGLRLLQNSPTRARGRGHARACLDAFRRPTALVSEGQKLRNRAHSCLDVSDGLARDAGQLAQASGVRVVLEESQVRAALDRALTEVASARRWDYLQFALEGGEDYALLATGPQERRPGFARVIGRVEGTGRGRHAGAFLESEASGAVARLTPLSGGFVHQPKE